MNNIISNSIFYILLSFILLTFTLFFINNIYTIHQLQFTMEYIIHENKGIIIFLSQLFYIYFSKKRSTSKIIINIIICWVLFILLNNIFPDQSYPKLISEIEPELFIDRGYLNSYKFSFLNLNFVKNIIRAIQNWQIADISIISSFIILLFNGSFLSFIDRHYKYNTFLKVLSIIIIFLFLLYFWNYQYNISLFVLSIYLLKSRKNNDKKN